MLPYCLSNIVISYLRPLPFIIELFTMTEGIRRDDCYCFCVTDIKRHTSEHYIKRHTSGHWSYHYEWCDESPEDRADREEMEIRRAIGRA